MTILIIISFIDIYEQNKHVIIIIKPKFGVRFANKNIHCLFG